MKNKNETNQTKMKQKKQNETKRLETWCPLKYSVCSIYNTRQQEYSLRMTMTDRRPDSKNISMQDQSNHG
jgi:hypothetical protein